MLKTVRSAYREARPITLAPVRGIPGKQAFWGCLGRAVPYPGNQTQVSRPPETPKLSPVLGRGENGGRAGQPWLPTPSPGWTAAVQEVWPSLAATPCPGLACFSHHCLSGLQGCPEPRNLICKGVGAHYSSPGGPRGPQLPTPLCHFPFPGQFV